jgi:predicted nucleotide-binding protein
MTVERFHTEATEINVFIGHGRNPQWRDLKDHLQDQHGIRVTSYEMRPRAGFSIKDILERMLSESSFAVLVLTGEDIHGDGEAHARENVVHELGLFQGRLGFTRAIALVEEGVKEFSNIYGMDQIRFSRGNIRETFGDILATIRREFKDSW